MHKSIIVYGLQSKINLKKGWFLSTMFLFSDASLVLTEDTDSFIIGDRVWVGGTKPGVISYIGETQFAPGEWAGVTLDDAIGERIGCLLILR